MATPFFKRIITEDFDSKDQNLVGKLAFIINPALQQLSSVSTGGLSLSDLNTQIKSLTTIVDANGNPTTALSFQSTLSDNCQFIQVGRAIDQTNAQTYPTGGQSVSFVQNGTNITIQNITGLVPNDTWVLTVIAYG